MTKKVLLNLTNQTVVRWLPPLIINGGHVDEAVEAVASVLGELDNVRKKEVPAGLVERK